MKSIYVVSMITENKLSVLQRVTSIITRNRLNIINIHAYEIANTDMSYLSLTFKSEDKIKNRVVLQLQRIIELIEIKINSQIPLIQN